MRFARSVVLVAVGVLWLAFGPLVLLAAALLLFVPRVRDWMRPTRRVVVIWVAAVTAIAGLVVLLPEGWVGITPGPGVWATPAYVGRPLTGEAQQGPIGESPTVTTRSYGVGECTDLVVDVESRIVALCGGDEPVLRRLDPESLRTEADVELPGTGCPGHLAAATTGVVAVSGQRLHALDTDDLAVTSSLDLADHLTGDDCVAGVGVDGSGRVWFVSAEGVVGVVEGGGVRTVDLADDVDRPLTVANDGAYVVGAAGLHRVGLRGNGPAVAWSAPYGEGGERGSAPVVLRNGLVAVADNRKPRLQVVLHRADTGEVVCRAEVFDDDEGAADGGLVAAGDSVVVTNAHGYAGTRSTLPGRTTSRGIALVGPDCTVTWTLMMNAPSGAPAVSIDDDLVYAWTKRHSWLGVDAWYLAAIDLGSGRLAWARRAGLTLLHDNHGGSVVLGPGKAAYATVLGGVVRIADR